jgi:hypothetical protein
MFDTEDLDCKCEDRKNTVIVDMDLTAEDVLLRLCGIKACYSLCYIPVYEDITRTGGRDDRFGYPRVCTSYPQNLRCK